MIRFPREPLDAEERALAARLPRPHGRAEPGAAIDARILAAAHAAAASPVPAATRRRRWMVPVGLAASLCLALGLAWRIQLAPEASPAAAGADAEQAPTAVAETRTARPESAVAAQQMQPVAPAEVAATTPSPPTARRSPAADAATMHVQMQATAIAPPPTAIEPAPAPAPMAAPPAPPAPPVATAVPPAPAADALAPPHARAAAAPSPAVAKARAAEPAVPAEDVLMADAPEADIPPATADAPEVREAWLRRIGELQRDGKTAEARASLAEFRRRYPDATLPAALRTLEVPAPEPASR